MKRFFLILCFCTQVCRAIRDFGFKILRQMCLKSNSNTFHLFTCELLTIMSNLNGEKPNVVRSVFVYQIDTQEKYTLHKGVCCLNIVIHS